MHWRRAIADGAGTALLLAAVVGSGIMGERLAQGNDAIALLANSLATGFALAALIIAFAPRSGAHFNPVVTLVLALRGDVEKREVLPYIVMQFIGALLGVAATHLMFDLPLVQYSLKARSSLGLWWSEAVATFGLVLVVLSCQRRHAWAAPLAVSSYIAAAYWFTASTSFANPAVTVARSLSNTFAGIAPADAPAFIAAQIVGMALALLAARFLESAPTR